MRDGKMETKSYISWFRGIVFVFLTSQRFDPSVKLVDLTIIHWTFSAWHLAGSGKYRGDHIQYGGKNRVLWEHRGGNCKLS